MQRWIIERAGSLDRLRRIEESQPILDPTRIRVAARAIGLNFADVFAVLGLYSATPKEPFTPGLEFAGLVESVGAASGGSFQPGDRVMGVTRFGGYATHVDVAPENCLLLPTSWSFPEGAAFPVQTLTAWYALRALGAVAPGHSVLIHSAAGGVGFQAMAICSKLGAWPVGTVRNEAKKAFLAEKGFDSVLVRPKSGHILAAFRDPMGAQAFDCVLDGIGGRVQRDSYRLLKPGGRLVAFGAADFMAPGRRPNWLHILPRYLFSPRYRPLDMISENKSVLAFNLIWLWDQIPRLRQCLVEALAFGLAPPPLDRCVDFDHAPDALQRLQSGESMGKVVLLTRDP